MYTSMNFLVSERKIYLHCFLTGSNLTVVATADFRELSKTSTTNGNNIVEVFGSLTSL